MTKPYLSHVRRFEMIATDVCKILGKKSPCFTYSLNHNFLIWKERIQTSSKMKSTMYGLSSFNYQSEDFSITSFEICVRAWKWWNLIYRVICKLCHYVVYMFVEHMTTTCWWRFYLWTLIIARHVLITELITCHLFLYVNSNQPCPVYICECVCVCRWLYHRHADWYGILTETSPSIQKFCEVLYLYWVGIPAGGLQDTASLVLAYVHV